VVELEPQVLLHLILQRSWQLVQHATKATQQQTEHTVSQCLYRKKTAGKQEVGGCILQRSWQLVQPDAAGQQPDDTARTSLGLVSASIRGLGWCQHAYRVAAP
jgi:hypothetical protein